MKEVVFIRQNKEKWASYEHSLNAIGKQSPDFLADIYIDVTNDLSFAQSHYPGAPVTRYLNGLSAKLHQFIYRKKKEKFSRMLTFWTRDVPEVMYHTRKELLYSFLIFAVAMLIGAFSTANDDTYVRLILGDQYVDMTLGNIANDDPMAVYKAMDEGIMFWGITINNIRVSFYEFISGIFTSIATAYLLVSNGIMIGSFQYFFYEQGLLWDSLLAIWTHGTLEISALIVAGAAGITMGNGWLFPKTYSRLVSFQRSAKQGVKIIVGTIPIFIIAGFLESFVTRHTEFPTFVRGLIILLSLGFVVFYYVVYPKKSYSLKNK
jgi:uncharacterized membrane protein SpoIIM required for sporulation